MNKDILEISKETQNSHSKDTKTYKYIEKEWKKYIQSSNLNSSEHKKAKINISPIGEIILPYFKMGNIDSLDLFGLDEIYIFSIYWFNKKNYKNVADIGANIGLHSIIMDKCGYKVDAYEPDPIHSKIFKKNINLNNSKNVRIRKFAVSDNNKEEDFVRVIGNTTGSHLKGAKNSYGTLETFKVKVKAINSIIRKYDLVKMDVEGEEAKIIKSITDQKIFNTTDFICEISKKENKKIIFDHLKKFDVRIFSQKINWQIVKKISDLPSSHREGSIFISQNKSKVW